MSAVPSETANEKDFFSLCIQILLQIMLATQGGRPSFPRVQQQALEAVISSTAGKKVFAKLKKQL